MPRYSFGPYALDVESRVLRRNRDVLPLSGKALDTLVLLVQNRGRVLAKDDLMSRLWPGTIVEEANLTQTIFTLRKILGDSPKDHQYIATLQGRGYQFVAAVSEIQEDAGAPNSITPTPQPPFLKALGPLRTRAGRLLAVTAAITLGALAWVASVVMRPSRVDLPSPAVPFTTLLGSAATPVFSPDGNSLAFVWSPEDDSRQSLYLKMIGSNAELRLTSAPGRDSSPAWSPDGRQIAFARDFKDHRGYYVISSLGGPARQVFQSKYGRGAGLAWLPDGRHLVLPQSNPPQIPSMLLPGYGSPPARLISVDLETGIVRPLTSPRPPNAMGDRSPVVSPDGRTIAFIRTFADGVEDVFLLPIAGGEARQLTSYRSQFGGISWTPDSREILFAYYRDSAARLWRIRIADREVKPVTSSAELVSNPTMALRGNRLAYIVANGRVDLWRMEFDASDPPKLNRAASFVSSTREHGDPMYSPDGRRLAFHSDRTGSVEIWTSDADGSNLAQLTNCGGSNNGSPRWSPDGTMIAFDSRSTGNPEIFVISVEGAGLRRITNHPAEDVVPSWSGDGQWIYFTSNRNGDFQIWKISAVTGETASSPAVQVTELGGFGAFESSDGRYLYFSKGRGKTGLWRKALTSDLKSPEQPILPSLQHWGWWALGKTGVFFIERPERPIGGKLHVKYLSFASSKVTEVSELEKAISPWHPAIAASPDERYLVYEQPEQIGSNIVLVENFK